MGRKRKFDRQESVRWVMDEMWRVGYDTCSVKYISDHLGITRSSFYHAFGSREELFSEVLELYCSESPDLQFNEYEQVESPLKLVTGVFKIICKVRAYDELHKGCLVVNSIAELVGNQRPEGKEVEEGVKNSISRFEKLLTRSVEIGELSHETDIAALALSLQNLMVGLNALCKVVDDEVRLWQMASMTLKGLGLYRD